MFLTSIEDTIYFVADVADVAIVVDVADSIEGHISEDSGDTWR